MFPLRPVGVVASLLAVLALAGPLDARTASAAPSAGERPYWRRNVFVRIWKDQKPLFLEWWPAELSRPAFHGPLAQAALIAATSDSGPNGGLDVALADRIDTACSGSCDDVADALTELTSAPVLLAGLGITYAVVRRSGDDRLAEAASLSVEALASSGLYNEALKLVFARVRPGGGSHGEFFRYGGAPPGQDLGSFPSGHAQGTFTVAAVFAGVYRDKRWVGWVSYGAASAVSLARVGLHRHFPSDVVAGGLVGASVGRFVVERGRGGLAPRRRAAALARLRPIVDTTRHRYGLSWVGSD